MIIFKESEELSAFLSEKKNTGVTIGFVPTMGALHAGHFSLIDTCKQQNDMAVCSIFVNPTQFNDVKDFEKYPITLENDTQALQKIGCDILFAPSVAEIYPNGLKNLPHYKLGYLETVLEGQYRPGHYQGVCQVVHRLLKIVQPNNLYLGQKDYQQCMAIKKLIALTQLKINVTVCPTLRETNGLAMSSRNMRLNDIEKKQATKISETLVNIKKEIQAGDISQLTKKAIQYLTNQGFAVDYVAITTADTLETIVYWDGQQKIVALVAAYLNQVRLIDNKIIN